VTLKQIVDIVGPKLCEVQVLASFLGQRSIRQIEKYVKLLYKKLTKEELAMLQDYHLKKEIPDKNDPFPEHVFTLRMEGISGPLTTVNKTTLKRIYSKWQTIIQVLC